MEFQVVKAMRALRDAFVHPERVLLDTELRVVSMFAVAMLLLTTVNTTTAIVVQQHPQLAHQMQQVRPSESEANQEAVPNREFTGQLGGALVVSMGSTLALAALLYVLVRFMLNVSATFTQSLTAASAAVGIGAAGTLLLAGLQVAFGSIQAGLHLGWLVSPSTSPHLFAWLQRVNVFTAWEHMAAASVLVSAHGHHITYGRVVGVTSWLITLIVFGGFSLLAWILSGAQ